VPYGSMSIGDIRVYSYVGPGEFTADKWFEGVKKGKTFVSNGPMVELSVDNAMPGDEIRVNKNKKLRIKAKCFADGKTVLLKKLEIVQNGKVIKSVKPSTAKQNELSVDFEIDAGFGSWIAARVQTDRGNVTAHTTPVYVVREGFRFWKFDKIDELIAKKLEYLKKIENKVIEAKTEYGGGKGTYKSPVRQFALQGDELLERVEAARKIYQQLKETAAKERPLRAK